MFHNNITFKNGTNLTFNTATPFSVDKLKDDKLTDGFVIIHDTDSGFTYSFRASEVATIFSSDREKLIQHIEAEKEQRQHEKAKPKKHKSSGFKSKIITK